MTSDFRLDHVLVEISKRERHFLMILFCKESESAIRFSIYPFHNSDLVSPFDQRYASAGSQILNLKMD